MMYISSKLKTENHIYLLASLVAQLVKNPSVMQEPQVRVLVWEDPLEKKRQPTPVFLLGKSHGLGAWWAIASPLVTKSWTQLSTYTHTNIHTNNLQLAMCYGEGNGNPRQYSCLENPMDGGAGWAAVHGIRKSQTRLKRLSSSSIHIYVSSSVNHLFLFHAFYFYSTCNY